MYGQEVKDETSLRTKSQELAREKSLAMIRWLLRLLSHRLGMGPMLIRWIPRLSNVYDHGGTVEDLDALLEEMSDAQDMPSPVYKALLYARYQ